MHTLITKTMATHNVGTNPLFSLEEMHMTGPCVVWSMGFCTALSGIVGGASGGAHAVWREC